MKMSSNCRRSEKALDADYSVEVEWGIFRRRLNRFTAQVYIESETPETVYVPSTGRMKELLVPGAPIGLLYRPSSNRKTAYTAAFVRHGETIVSIDAHLPNKLMGQWLTEGRLAPLPRMEQVRPEVGFGSSRFDFAGYSGQRQYLIEVKSVTLVEDGVAMFPDAPTKRGERHIRELITALDYGLHAVVVFVIQRGDGRVFTPNAASDEDFARAVQEAHAAGVQFLAYRYEVTTDRSQQEVQIRLAGQVPVEI
ncbi:MAG: DNA/RNA nuclease SfsA [Firmicutes bacterium]|nr:DNA/RNA nuclease SfsA [Bacillota bacterium]